MLITSALLASLLSAGHTNAAPASRSAEKHVVVIINKCGVGRGVFMTSRTDDRLFTSGEVVHGPLYGGKAWVDGWAGCEMSGKNCGVIEFTLINTGTGGANAHSSVNYSLQSTADGLGMGNHQFRHPMSWRYLGDCPEGPPGPCIGPGAELCPGAFWGDNTENGTPVACHSDNAGIEITFC